MARFKGIRPASLRDGLRLGAALAMGAGARLLSPSRFRGSGAFLTGRSPVEVRADGVRFRIRPRSEDLQYVGRFHKPAVGGWFDPRPGDRVLDVGAHVGGYALWAAARGARVDALEPNPRTAAALRANLAANPGLSVRIVQVAAGRDRGFAKLRAERIWDGRASLLPGWAAGPLGGSTEEYRVRVEPLDGLFDAGSTPVADWLLVDVEGSELAALEGARALLRRTRNLILELGPADPAAARAVLRASGGLEIVAEHAQTPSTTYLWARRAERAGAAPSPGSSEGGTLSTVPT